MILKASTRGGGKQLADHLSKTDENEHVELHELRGFISEDLGGAFKEAYAISRGTRCQKFLFSLSLNPPENENVPIEVFEAAIERIEAKLGLEGQPRAVVFHEKEGRRHAHCVWSRIDAQEMKAIQLPHFKRKINDIAKELYLEHGWKMPKGFIDSRSRDPLSFTRAEWQQAKRTNQDPKARKAMFRECWAASDDRQSFEHALRERGYFLARGDRRGFVAVDFRGEVYSLSRDCGVKTKQLKERLGSPEKLQSVEELKCWISERMTERLKAHVDKLTARRQKSAQAIEYQRGRMVSRHRGERSALKSQQANRTRHEEKSRAVRLPRGMRALWSWVTGQTKKIRMQNALESKRAQERDRAEREAVIKKQLTERRKLQTQIKRMRSKQHEAEAELNRDVAFYMMMGGKAPIEITDTFERQAKHERSQDREGPAHEPD